jgi:hypothetical protein
MVCIKTVSIAGLRAELCNLGPTEYGAGGGELSTARRSSAPSLHEFH